MTEFLADNIKWLLGVLFSGVGVVLIGLLFRGGRGGYRTLRERRRENSIKNSETQPLTVSIGESAYIASHPYVPDREVKDIILQVMLGNPNPSLPKTIMTFRLEVNGKPPYPLSEARISNRTGGWYLVPSGGGYGGRGGYRTLRERRRENSIKNSETQPLTVSIGESAYIASHPYVPDREVKDIILQVMLGNPNPSLPKTIMTFRLEVNGKPPYPLSEARISNRTGGWYLVPSGGGFSTVPNKDYLTVPLTVPPGGAVVGWIGFCTLERADLLLEEAQRIDGEVVVVQPDGTELRSILPPSTLQLMTED